MKILICTFSFPAPKIKHFGGNFVAGEAIAYAKNGATVLVLTPYIKGADKREQLYENVEVIRFQYLWPKCLQTLLQPNQPIYSQKSFFSLVKIPFLCFIFALKIFKYSACADIIHAQWTLSALLALPSKWIRRTKIVLTARGSDISLLPLWLNRFIHHSINGAIDCFGPQTWNEEYKRKFKANYIKLPLIVHNNTLGSVPDDLQSILHRKPDLFIILYIGRFDFKKIQDHNLPMLELIHAANIIRKNCTDFHVIYLGDGEVAMELEGFIKHYRLDQFVSMLGPKNNVFDYIKYCNLGVGGVAFNGVSEEFTVSAKPQLLVEGGANLNTPWIEKENTLYFRGGDRNHLISKLIWAISNRYELENIGKRAKRDMAQLITDSENGGRLYLKEFCKLIQM